MTFKWNDYRKNVKYVTRASFADLPLQIASAAEGYKPTWSIEDEDHDGLFSFRKWFLKFYTDPTESEFVKHCFESDYTHWETFKTSKDIKKYYETYKREAETLLLADTMRKIFEVAMDTSNKSSMTALKYLADRGAKALGEPGPSKGRPKKADIDRAAREIAEEDKDLLSDLKRIGV